MLLRKDARVCALRRFSTAEARRALMGEGCAGDADVVGGGVAVPVRGGVGFLWEAAGDCETVGASEAATRTAFGSGTGLLLALMLLLVLGCPVFWLLLLLGRGGEAPTIFEGAAAVVRLLLLVLTAPSAAGRADPSHCLRDGFACGLLLLLLLLRLRRSGSDSNGMRLRRLSALLARCDGCSNASGCLGMRLLLRCSCGAEGEVVCTGGVRPVLGLMAVAGGLSGSPLSLSGANGPFSAP